MTDPKVYVAIPEDRLAYCASCRAYFNMTGRSACPTCGGSEGWMLMPMGSFVLSQIAEASAELRECQKRKIHCHQAEATLDRLLIQWLSATRRDQKKEKSE